MKRPTIADIARRAGVSTGAVSYALNGQPGVSPATRARILAIADEIGWRPNFAARALSVSRAHAIGLVIARPARLLGVEPFFMQFIAGVESELSATRVALLLQLVPDHEAGVEAVRQLWAERRIDGLIVMDLWTADVRVPVLDRLRIPAVLVGRPRPDSALPSVWSDDGSAVTTAVDYLVTLGHRRIARVAGPPELDHTQVRTDAFRAALTRHRLPRTQVLTTDYTWEAGAHATRTLLARRDRPSAITYDNDVMAVAALSVAREMGIAVPEELSIVAGDDSQLCVIVHPALTALARDITAYGSQVAGTLLELLDGAEPRSHQAETARIVPRGSTAAINS